MNDSEIRRLFRDAWHGKMHEALQLMDTVAGVLNSMQIRWCLVSGTLLGSIRHKNVIPWDHDLDISVYAYAGIDEIIIELRQLNIYCIKQTVKGSDYYTISYTGKYEDAPWIDLFHHELLNESTVRSFGHIPSVYTDVPIESWFPYSTGPLESMTLPTPHLPEVYLNKLYPGWREYGESAKRQRVSMDKLRELGLC